MKPILSAVLLLALVVGYYQACAIPAARQEERRMAQDRAHLDSLAAVASRAAALERLRDSTRRAWLARDRVAGQRAAELERQLALVSDSAAAAVAQLDATLAALPDTARAAVTGTIGLLTTEIRLCREALGVQRDRLTDCQQTSAVADSLTRITLPAFRAVADSALALARRWQERARKAERPFALGPYAGYGLTAVDGRVEIGPQVGIGATLRWVPIPPW